MDALVDCVLECLFHVDGCRVLVVCDVDAWDAALIFGLFLLTTGRESDWILSKWL
jgi:hypothetical protein